MSKEKDQKELNKELAHEYAKSKGFETMSDLTASVNAKLASENIAERSLGRAIAQETVQDLLLLCLRQDIIDAPLPNYMNIVEKVFDGFMEEGNEKEYISKLKTGVSQYANTLFVPTKQTVKKLEKYILQIFTSKGQRNPKAYQFMKELTIPHGEWTPYFKSGQLNQYIQGLQTELNEVYKMYIFEKLCGFIVDESTNTGKVITSQATNLFDAWVELLPEIERMYEYNSEFNVEQASKVMYAANPEDILIFTSTKVRSITKNGIKSQLFNANLLGTSAKTLTDENLITLGNKIQVTTKNGDTIIEDSKTPWIPDNRIFVLDISRIKHIVQLDQAGSQFFQANVTDYISKNVWGVMDILPWCKKITFKMDSVATFATQIGSRP